VGSLFFLVPSETMADMNSNWIILALLLINLAALLWLVCPPQTQDEAIIKLGGDLAAEWRQRPSN
jgi:hypothetical protein